jgi:hypothetical protein
MGQNSDWEKLSPEQQTAVNAWRERTGRHLTRYLSAEAEVLYVEHPELRLTWNFTSEPLIRADHPVILEEL